jgi:putative transposase
MKLFSREADYQAFIRTLAQAARRIPGVRILAYCVMPNHFHLVLLPANDEDLSRFMGWLTMTHALRWRYARKLVGLGPLYQGRFKSFPIEADEHLETVLRYIERNALRAKLVSRAEQWRWCSLYAALHPTDSSDIPLGAWPIERRSDWVKFVNTPQTDKEIAEIEKSMRTGRPLGDADWTRKIAKQMGLPLEERGRGRPKGSRNKPKSK